MNVFKKLQGAVSANTTTAVASKKEKSFSGFEEVSGQRGIDISDVDKLKANDLAEIIRKYDQLVIKLRKEQQSVVDQNEELSQKASIIESQLRCKLIECEDQSTQLAEQQKILNAAQAKSQSLAAALELSIKQNEHMKGIVEQQEGESEVDEADARVVIKADSELLLFTTQDELRLLRRLFEQLQRDTQEFVESLAKQGDVVTAEEAEKRQRTKEAREEEGGEEGEAEEELTLEELCGNTWDSLAQLNEQMEQMVTNMTECRDKQKLGNSTNIDAITSYEAVIASKQKQLDSLQTEKDKLVGLCSQTTRESNEFSKSLMEERVRRAELEDRVGALVRQLNEAVSDRDNIIAQLNILREEKEMINVQLQSIKASFSSEEEKTREEIEDLQRECDELADENASLDEELKKVKEELFLKIKELDNKDRQEKIKAQQTAKEMGKLEARVSEAQEDLNKQVETHHESLQRLKVLEEKRVAEKSKMKLLKEKAKSAQEELSRLKLENARDLGQRNKQLDELEEEVRVLRQRTNVKDEINKLTLEKDLKVSSLEIQLSEANTLLKSQTEEISKLTQYLDEDVKVKQADLERQVKLLQEKREAGLQEIQKLNKQIEMMKTHSNPTTQAKMVEIQTLVDKASALGRAGGVGGEPAVAAVTASNSSSSLFNGDTSGSSSGNPSIKFFKNAQLGVVQKSPSSSSSSSKIAPAQQQTPVLNRKEEMKFIAQLKKEMEGVYKEFISSAIGESDETKEQSEERIRRIERKINLSIKKAQDLMDTIEDLEDC